MNTAFIIVCSVLSCAIMFLNITGYLEEDSLAEELVEEVIEEIFDEEIDLSPNSHE